MTLPELPPTRLPTALVRILPAFARDEEGAAGSFASRRRLTEKSNTKDGA
jgi:hypothetical protein